MIRVDIVDFAVAGLELEDYWLKSLSLTYSALHETLPRSVGKRT